MAVIRSLTGILDWTKEQMRNMDRKTLKMMTLNGRLHTRANVSMLYLPRDEGGRGLTSIEEAIETEEYGLSDKQRSQHTSEINKKRRNTRATSMNTEPKTRQRNHYMDNPLRLVVDTRHKKPAN